MIRGPGEGLPQKAWRGSDSVGGRVVGKGLYFLIQGANEEPRDPGAWGEATAARNLPRETYRSPTPGRC